MSHAQPSAMAGVLLSCYNETAMVIRGFILTVIYFLGLSVTTFANPAECSIVTKLAAPRSLPPIKTYAERVGKDPEEFITVTCGGGYRFYQSFLKGENEGYRLEGPGVGIQVTPENPELSERRDQIYARKALEHNDQRAVMQFRIQRKHLDASPNFYEAGLRSPAIPYAQDFVIRNLDTGEVLTGKDATTLRVVAKP